jgi:hypothetical protein
MNKDIYMYILKKKNENKTGYDILSFVNSFTDDYIIIPILHYKMEQFVFLKYIYEPDW